MLVFLIVINESLLVTASHELIRKVLHECLSSLVYWYCALMETSTAIYCFGRSLYVTCWDEQTRDCFIWIKFTAFWDDNVGPFSAKYAYIRRSRRLSVIEWHFLLQRHVGSFIKLFVSASWSCWAKSQAEYWADWNWVQTLSLNTLSGRSCGNKKGD